MKLFPHLLRRLAHLREELALWQARRLAQSGFSRLGVRHFIVPSPEGVLRVLTWREALQLRGQHYFPRHMNIVWLYRNSIWWTAATRRPKHGNSLAKPFIDRESLYRWWYMTHR
jgi:hypothetical protein